MSQPIITRNSTVNANPGTTLLKGELAYSYTSGILSIGNANGPGVGNNFIEVGGSGVFNRYAPLASPTFTGTVLAPTPVSTSNDTTVATTAFVKTVAGAGTANPVIGGAGLVKTGDTLDVVSANAARIVINADSIDLATIGTAGTFRSVTVDAYGRVSAGTNPTTLTGYGITDAQALDADLTSISNLSAAARGFITRTADGTVTTRSLAGISARTTITNADGVSGNPTVDISSTYVGQTSITTLGTITTGVWSGTTIATAKGGTGDTGTFTGLVKANGASAYTQAVADTDYLTPTSTIDGGTF